MLAVGQMVIDENETIRKDGINEGIIRVAKEMLKNGVEEK